MTLLIDAAPLIALADRRDPQLILVRRILKAERGPLVLPAPITAEIDYLIQQRAGAGANRAFLADLRAGRYQVECLMPSEYAEVERLNRLSRLQFLIDVQRGRFRIECLELADTPPY